MKQLSPGGPPVWQLTMIDEEVNRRPQADQAQRPIAMRQGLGQLYPQRLPIGRVSMSVRRIADAASARFISARPAILSLLIGAVVWELVGQLWHISFLPPFSRVLLALAQLTLSGQIVGNLTSSVLALTTGYGLAVISGIPLGLLMGRYRKVEYWLNPYVSIFLATPKLVFVPVLLAVFGVSRSVQIVVVFLNAFFIIIVSTASAIRTVDASYIEMARAFGAREGQLFWKVLLPNSMPLTMAGLRVAMGRAVKGMINGELFITVFGLGMLLRRYGGRFDAEKAFAILLVVIGVALVFSFIVQLVERRLTHWTELES